MAAIAYIRCPQCNTVIEKPATGAPVCPTCGFGASALPPKKAATKTASRPAAKNVAAAPSSPPQPAWTPAPAAPAAPVMMSPPAEGMPMPRNSGKAVAAMVVGIVACCIGFVPFVGAFLALPAGIVALVLGILGVKECDRDPAHVKGKGMAVTGIVLGSIMIVIGLVLLIAFTVGIAALEEAVCEEDPDSEACQNLRDSSLQKPAHAADPWAAAGRVAAWPGSLRLAGPGAA